MEQWFKRGFTLQFVGATAVWILAVFIVASLWLFPSERLQVVILLGVASTLLLGVVLAVIVRRNVFEPLVRLDAQARRLGEGDLDTPITLPGDDEFGRMARSLDLMRKRLRDQMRVHRLMFGELDHRVRNNLASLQSLIDLAERTAPDRLTMAASIRSRVHAMAVVHSMLSLKHWEPVDLEEMFEQLRPPGSRDQVHVTAESVKVPASQATALGMVIQELMTNSLKHGALSVPEGRVDIHWDRGAVALDGEQQVILTWRESGGPPIEDGGVRFGGGSELVEGFLRSDLNGEVELKYPPGGVSHRMVIVLRHMQTRV